MCLFRPWAKYFILKIGKEDVKEEISIEVHALTLTGCANFIENFKLYFSSVNWDLA